MMLKRIENVKIEKKNENEKKSVQNSGLEFSRSIFGIQLIRNAIE